MNGKQAKSIRRLAAGLATVAPKMEGAKVGYEGKESTKRVRTADNGRTIQTETMVHAEGTYRRVYKDLKRDEVHTLAGLGVI